MSQIDVVRGKTVALSAFSILYRLPALLSVRQALWVHTTIRTRGSDMSRLAFTAWQPLSWDTEPIGGARYRISKNVHAMLQQGWSKPSSIDDYRIVVSTNRKFRARALSAALG